MTNAPRYPICEICGDDIQPDMFGWTQGHNAQPVADGRCCTICNDTVVIPTRLNRLIRKPYRQLDD